MKIDAGRGRANRRPTPYLEDLRERAEWCAAQHPRPRPALARLEARSSNHAAEFASRKAREHEARVDALQAELDAAGPDPDDRWAVAQSLESAEQNLHFARGDVSHHRAAAAEHERRYRRELGSTKPPALTRGGSLAIVRTARARGAGRPRARAVARAASRGGDSGDDSSGSEPPGEQTGRPLLYLAHPRWGRCTPELLRALLRAGRGEVAR